MRIAIASDHNGVELKSRIADYLTSLGHEVVDCSMNNYPTDDYPDFAFKVCNKVVAREVSLGILMCGTGIGMSIAANKVNGIRCAKCDNSLDAKLARNDNGANVIAFSFKKDFDDIKDMLKTFIEAEPLNSERHFRRVHKIISYEQGEYNEL